MPLVHSSLSISKGFLSSHIPSPPLPYLTSPPPRPQPLIVQHIIILILPALYTVHTHTHTHGLCGVGTYIVFIIYSETLPSQLSPHLSPPLAASLFSLFPFPFFSPKPVPLFQEVKNRGPKRGGGGGGGSDGRLGGGGGATF